MTGFTFGQPSQPTNTATVNPLMSSGNGFNLGGSVQTTSSSGSGVSTTGLAFAQPTSTSTNNLFGQTSTTGTSSGLNFGFPSSSLGLTGLGTSNTITTTGLGGLLGQPSLAPTSTVGFGQTSLVSSGAGGLFSSTVATTATGGGLFGVVNPASTATGLLGQANPTSSTTSGLFGTNLTTTSTPTPSNLFGTPSTGVSLFNQPSTPSSTGFSLNLMGQTSAPSATPSLGLGGNLPTTLAATSTTGLGGFQPTAVDTGDGSSSSKNDGKCVKETPLPQDIFSTMVIFENYKDVEKKASEENVRQTATPFHKLIDDTKKLRQHVIQLSNQHAQLHSSARKLKSSVIQEAESVEMARRTQDTPMGLQGDNKSPEQFFLRLVRSFEERMTYCRNKIDEVEKCSQSNGGLSKITSEDMKEVLKKEHEMVKVLAAKVYTLHNQLINHCCKSNNPNQLHPGSLFKPVCSQNESIGIGHKDSSVLRPCLGEGGSGLLNFQSGQQRAKAVSLGAAPPTLSLGQSSGTGILGSSTQSGLFGTPSNAFGFNNSSLNFGGGSNQITNTIGSPSPNISGGLFTSTNLGNSSVSGFGLGNTSFGSPKPFGKSSSDHDESQRKRRM